MITSLGVANWLCPTIQIIWYLFLYQDKFFRTFFCIEYEYENHIDFVKKSNLFSPKVLETKFEERGYGCWHPSVICESLRVVFCPS